MTDNTGGPSGVQPAGQAEHPRIGILAQYVKDLSFENPNAPESLSFGGEPPQISITVDVRAQGRGEQRYEVAIKLSAEAKQKDKIAFVAELEYAGLFALTNFNPEQVETACLIECPRHLFPFARRILADISRDGGFPPLMLEPIDFADLFRSKRQRPSSAPPPAG